ncbi:50S ribosome-binding GTPase, partial [Rhizoctonia solani AG-3 Rhs1AP]
MFYTMKRKSEDSDITASGSSDSTLRAGETRKTEVSREVLIEEPRPTTSKLPIRILIVGPSGFGKTQTINDFCHRTKEPTINGIYQPTKRIMAQRFLFDGEIIELIDTPGFDNIDMSDLEAFTDIAEYLLNPKRIHKGITGIIYVHRAGNTVHSRSLLRNFRVLTNIFLGHTGITRLTFLVTQTGTQGVSYRNVLDEMKARGSVFGYTFPAGAVIAATPNQTGFIATLRSYLSQTPIMLPVQLNDSYKSHATFAARIEKELGYYEYQSAQSLLDGLEHQLRMDYENKLVDRRETDAQLQRELQKSQLEYSSLRSQLQLQENIEQSQVVQTLHDLNRMIEDLGRSVSSYLYDEYVTKAFDIDPADVTTLNASDLPALKSLAGHKHGMTSFIKTTSGQGMQIECFLDFMIRNKICLHLDREIFSPFHPGISSSLSQVLSATFENIQKQGHVPSLLSLRPQLDGGI